MSDPWKELAERLVKRDKAEKTDSEYFKAFAQMARLRATTADASLDKLVRENCEIREENETLVTRLNTQTVRLESANGQILDLQKAVKSRDSKMAKLQKRITQLTQELSEKNRLFEILNDEHLIAQIQLNVLKELNERGSAS